MTELRDIEGVLSMGEPLLRPLPTALEIARRLPLSDDARTARRRECRKKIAAADVAEKSYLAIQREIASCEAKKEELASQHVQKCRPLQDEIAEIDRAEPDASLEIRRAELRQFIHEANEELRRKIAVEDERTGRLFSEGRKAALPIMDRAEATNLLSSELARAELRINLHVVQNRLKWCERRCASLEANNLDDRFSNRELLDALIADARHEAAQATADLEAAYRATVDE